MMPIVLIFTFLTTCFTISLTASEGTLLNGPEEHKEAINYDVLLIEATHAVARLGALYDSGQRVFDGPIREIVDLHRLFSVDIMGAPHETKIALRKAYFRGCIFSLKKGDTDTLREFQSPYWSLGYVDSVDSLLYAIMNPEHANEMEDLTNEMIQQLNMEALIKTVTDAHAFTTLAAQK